MIFKLDRKVEKGERNDRLTCNSKSKAYLVKFKISIFYSFEFQSSSKPFTYAVCLNELGAKSVHQYVGQEPSGRMFNELTLDFNDKPHNPLLNSGAIMSCAILLSLVKPDMKISEKFDFLLEYLKKIGGGEFIR